MFNIKNIWLDKFTPKFVSNKKINKLLLNENYQIIQILPKNLWKKSHIIFSVQIDPNNFINEYQNKLDKSKKIILYGNYHSLARFYRILKLNKYDVYLIRFS